VIRELFYDAGFTEDISRITDMSPPLLSVDRFRPDDETAADCPIDDVIVESSRGDIEMPGDASLNLDVARHRDRSQPQLTLVEIERATFESYVNHLCILHVCVEPTRNDFTENKKPTFARFAKVGYLFR
jgi:hypothetical protein